MIMISHKPFKPLVDSLIVELNAMPHLFDLDSIKYSQIADLRKNNFLFKEHGLFIAIGLNTPNKIQLTPNNIAHKQVHLLPILSGQEPLPILHLLMKQ
jgi:hypothetical protein